MHNDVLRMKRALGIKAKLRYIVLAAFCFALFTNPGSVFLLALIAVFFVCTLISIMGVDRVWNIIVRRLVQMHETDPERATLWVARLEKVAVYTDGFLNLFPKRFVAPLYAPDLSVSAPSKNGS